MPLTDTERQQANLRRWAQLLDTHATNGIANRQYLHTRDRNGAPGYCAWGLAVEALGSQPAWRLVEQLPDGGTLYRPADADSAELPSPTLIEAFGFPEAMITTHCNRYGCQPDVAVPIDDIAPLLADAIPDCYFTEDGDAVTIVNLSSAMGAAGWPTIARFLERHADRLAATDNAPA